MPTDLSTLQLKELTCDMLKDAAGRLEEKEKGWW
jgi:hypothetical protein